MIKNDEVVVSVKPPDSLGAIWHNPETGLSAHGINGPGGSTLWVSTMEKFANVPGLIDDTGYFLLDVTHDLLKTGSSVLLTQILASSCSSRSPWNCMVPIGKSILDPGDVLEVRYFVGSDLPKDKCRLSISFREILAVARNI